MFRHGANGCRHNPSWRAERVHRRWRRGEILQQGNEPTVPQVVTHQPVRKKGDPQPVPSHREDSLAVVRGEAAAHRYWHLRLPFLAKRQTKTAFISPCRRHSWSRSWVGSTGDPVHLQVGGRGDQHATAICELPASGARVRRNTNSNREVEPLVDGVVRASTSRGHPHRREILTRLKTAAPRKDSGMTGGLISAGVHLRARLAADGRRSRRASSR